MDKNKFKNHDWSITIIAIIIQIIGILIIFSTTYDTKNINELSQETIKQILFCIFGLIIYFSLSFIDISWLENKNLILLLYGIIIALLLYVRLFGEEIANTHRWIKIGPMSLQPAEYAKLVIILMTSIIFTTKKSFIQKQLLKISRISKSVKNINIKFPNLFHVIDNLLIMIPILILILIQPALGNTIITTLLWLIALYIILPSKWIINSFFITSGILITLLAQFINFNIDLNKDIISFSTKDVGDIGYTTIFIILLISILVIKYLRPSMKILFSSMAIVGVVMFSSTIIWNFVLKDYQRTRIEVFFQGADSAKSEGGYQIIQSQVAIGSGMIWGRGYLSGSQSGLKILSEAYNDFIYASFAEQFGFVGSTLLLSLYSILIYRIIHAANQAKNDFGRYVCISVSILLLLHIFINIGMNLGKLPVTGIPLPLMSSGGSAILMTMIALGFVQSVNSSKRAVDFADNLMLTSTSRIENF
jgi:rod shape determining protein RodA